MLYMCVETLGDRQARKEISTPSIMTSVGEPVLPKKPKQSRDIGKGLHANTHIHPKNRNKSEI